MKLFAWARGDVPVGRLNPVRQQCLEAYDRVEQLPRGPERRAAWAAYALVTYGDKLLAAGHEGCVDRQTAAVAAAAYAGSAACLAPGGTVPGSLPNWRAGSLSEPQLRGMQETLVALSTFLAYDAGAAPGAEVASRVGALDARLSTVARLWVPRPTAELRGGIAGALRAGLDDAYALGLELAVAQPPPSSL